MRILQKKWLAAVLAVSMTVTPYMSAEGRENTKADYIKRYEKLEKRYGKELISDGDSTFEMRINTDKQFKAWDKELNYVYKKIYKKLDSSRKGKLKNAQLKWIKKKEKQAKKEAGKYTGGTMYPLVYTATLTDMTKKRLKWLIKNYG